MLLRDFLVQKLNMGINSRTNEKIFNSLMHFQNISSILYITFKEK